MRSEIVMRHLGISVLAALLVSATLCAGEWPQFLGPDRDGVSKETISGSWPAAGPRVIWKQDVGVGFSAPVVSAGRLVIFHRLGEREVVDCLDAATGERVWRSDYATTYRDDYGKGDGPRATPTIVVGFVFTFGAGGLLHCVDFKNGSKVWSVDTMKKFDVKKPFFGVACSPVVEGKNVLMIIGGAEKSGIVAFDRSTGKVAWTATDHQVSYASPVVTTIGGKRHGLFYTRRGLVDLDPATGEHRFDFDWRPRQFASVNAASPVVVGDRVFLSTSYDKGAVLLRIAGSAAEQLWSSDDAITSHYATSVHRDGFLYGHHGRQESGQMLRCIELGTGKVRWSTGRVPAGSLLLARDRLLVVQENGEIVLAAARPEKFETLARATVLKPTVRAYPALSNGRLYLRDDARLVCLDVSGSE